jgi:hypothetical protein
VIPIFDSPKPTHLFFIAYVIDLKIKGTGKLRSWKCRRPPKPQHCNWDCLLMDRISTFIVSEEFEHWIIFL